MTSGGAASSIPSATPSRPRKSGTRTSIVVAGEACLTSAMHFTKCPAPPSFRSSRSTLVTTTYRSFSAAMVSARWRGSSASGASGRPCATSQNGQRRVQMSPRIMKVAVPLPKHSAMFGQEASSHTVCSFCSRRIRLISPKREFGLAARTRIQGGLGSGCACACGTMRMVFFAPFSFTPASRMFDSRHDGLRQLIANSVDPVRKPEVLHLRHGQPRVAARVDSRKGRKVHLHVEREPMVAAPARHADAERRDLRATNVDAGRAGPALRPGPHQIDHRLLEERDELLDL